MLDRLILLASPLRKWGGISKHVILNYYLQQFNFYIYDFSLNFHENFLMENLFLICCPVPWTQAMPRNDFVNFLRLTLALFSVCWWHISVAAALIYRILYLVIVHRHNNVVFIKYCFDSNCVFCLYSKEFCKCVYMNKV